MSRQGTGYGIPAIALLLSIFWWVWSFTQTDPNLYYSSNSIWVRFQQAMWQIDKPVVVGWYIVMITVAFALYIHFALRHFRGGSVSAPASGIQSDYRRHWIPAFARMTNKYFLTVFAVCSLLLAISNNALSHDIYNYMFNAKAIAIYHQDPHLQSALEIAPSDDWVRFMHNTHTSAPYGRLWTYFTLLPYSLGFGKFLSTYMLFKIWMGIGYLGLCWVAWRMLRNSAFVALFALNPLVLIETFANGHNDVWMMFAALSSFALLLPLKKLDWVRCTTSLACLVFSYMVKEATFVLVPLWLALFASLVVQPKFLAASTRLLEFSKSYWPELAAGLLFLPLLTARSQQFHPWYLIWSLTFVPFMKVSWIKSGLLIFSLTSMLRYLSFLYVGSYSDELQWQMRLITWSALPVTCIWWLLTRKTK